MEKRRQTALVQSQLQARAAASGAGAIDATVLKLGEDISGRGEQSALLDMANGESRARGMENQANAARVSGQNQRQGALLSAAGTIASGLGSAFGKFKLPGGDAGGMPLDISNGFG